VAERATHAAVRAEAQRVKDEAAKKDAKKARAKAE
jgi:hypothetical protein